MPRGRPVAPLPALTLLVAISAQAQAQPHVQPEAQPPAQPQVQPYEPPLPPEPAPPAPPSPRAAPHTALWLGARVGYELPVGAAFTSLRNERYQERDVQGPGPSVEIDVGGRFGKRFIPFLYFAHTFSGAGSAEGPPPSGSPTSLLLPEALAASKVSSSSSNLLGLGLRYAFGTDGLGFLAEVAYGYRLTRTRFADGTLLRAGAPGEFRIGLGADIRLARSFSLSPLLRLATGSYSDVTVEGADGREKNALGGSEAHGFLGLEVGGHFDLLGRYD